MAWAGRACVPMRPILAHSQCIVFISCEVFLVEGGKRLAALKATGYLSSAVKGKLVASV